MINTVLFLILIILSNILTAYLITRKGRTMDRTDWLDIYLQGYKRKYRMGLRSDGAVVWQMRRTEENYN